MFLIFLDVDGVLNKLPRKDGSDGFEPDLMANLNWVCRNIHGGPVKIVINSAWNSVDTMGELMVEAGFEHPNNLGGRTAGTQGGGDLVRKWLKQWGKGEFPSFAIVDDSGHSGHDRDYREMWCRLAKCDARYGLTREVAEQIVAISQRGCNPLDDQAERRAAITHLVDHLMWLASNTPWLNDTSRGGYLKESLDLILHCLTVPDFLGAAMLQRPV